MEELKQNEKRKTRVTVPFIFGPSPKKFLDHNKRREKTNKRRCFKFQWTYRTSTANQCLDENFIWKHIQFLLFFTLKVHKASNKEHHTVEHRRNIRRRTRCEHALNDQFILWSRWAVRGLTWTLEFPASPMRFASPACESKKAMISCLHCELSWKEPKKARLILLHQHELNNSIVVIYFICQVYPMILEKD